jgi:hypothetical protein
MGPCRVENWSRILLFQVTSSLYAHDGKTIEGVENNYIAALLYSSESSVQSHQGALTTSTKQNDDDQAPSNHI